MSTSEFKFLRFSRIVAYVDLSFRSISLVALLTLYIVNLTANVKVQVFEAWVKIFLDQDWSTWYIFGLLTFITVVQIGAASGLLIATYVVILAKEAKQLVISWSLVAAVSLIYSLKTWIQGEYWIAMGIGLPIFFGIFFVVFNFIVELHCAAKSQRNITSQV